jgi:RNA polymerase sigma factor (sigma-70 family)
MTTRTGRPSRRKLADVDDMTWFAERFEENRPRLLSVAYRMLGSRTEAEDALQEAWLRSTRADGSTIDNVPGWLTTVVGRVCIDLLRSRQARHESLTGTWLPEPVVSRGESPDPEEESLLADSVGLALLVVLETLDPAERLAFVLHDMFAVPFAEIAPIVERSPEATRQLASRARRRVRGTPTTPDADLPTQRRVVAAFLAAARAGDFAALLEVLDPDVVFRVDAGGRASLAPALLTGAVDVAERAAAQGPRFASLCRPALVNGAAGIVARGSRGHAIAVVGITVIGERIAEIDLILDPAKVASVDG